MDANPQPLAQRLQPLRIPSQTSLADGQPVDREAPAHLSHLPLPSLRNATMKKGFLIDMDGVIYRSSELIPGAGNSSIRSSGAKYRSCS